MKKPGISRKALPLILTALAAGGCLDGHQPAKIPPPEPSQPTEPVDIYIGDHDDGKTWGPREMPPSEGSPERLTWLAGQVAKACARIAQDPRAYIYSPNDHLGGREVVADIPLGSARREESCRVVVGSAYGQEGIRWMSHSAFAEQRFRGASDWGEAGFVEVVEGEQDCFEGDKDLTLPCRDTKVLQTGVDEDGSGWFAVDYASQQQNPEEALSARELIRRMVDTALEQLDNKAANESPRSKRNSRRVRPKPQSPAALPSSGGEHATLRHESRSARGRSRKVLRDRATA